MNDRCSSQVTVQARILPDDSEDLESGRAKLFEALGRQQLDLAAVPFSRRFCSILRNTYLCAALSYPIYMSCYAKLSYALL